MIRILFYIILFIFFYNSCTLEDENNIIKSPDKKISVSFHISKENRAFYDIYFEDTLLMQNCELGIIREDDNFSKNLILKSISPKEFLIGNYTMLYGKRKEIIYKTNKKIFHLSNSTGEKMDIIFQVSNDGIAFRYYFPERSGDIKTIINEITAFNFNEGTKAWIQPMSESKSGWCEVNPSYEENYTQEVDIKNIPRNKAGWVFPALFKTGNHWILLSETAPDRNYCGCRLIHNKGENLLRIGFPQKTENFPGGNVLPESTLPWFTPWRIIALSNNPGSIVESTLGTDLAKPSILENTAFIKPGRSSWSWVLLKDDSTVYDVQKKFIDYSSDMGWEYCLIDADWDIKIGYDKIKELADYAKTKNVGLSLWYNSSGEWNSTTYHPKSMLVTSDDREKEFSRLKEMGIKGVKVDFFGGDGQSMMAYYQDIFEDAAKYELMVNCHGSTIPRGWQRTYPNLMSMEAIRGFEFVTFEQSNANLQATKCCLIPFTRNAFDPMDFTPVCFSEVPNINRKTSNAFELALSVIFLSGIQHYAEIPGGMAKVPDYVKQLMKEIPVIWEDTKFIDGYPGKFVIIARKTHNVWYVAGINANNVTIDINLILPFIKNKNGILVTDGDNNRSFKMLDIQLDENNTYNISINSKGGFVLKF
ncbi:MAG: glycoside hydrolase family 97 catalytic domain-containing protein [Bacteroidales bacterium]|nr:glycoside hydrolase family 97 catalytic domain-containing protein [Bacteroidales bacterium]